MSTYTEEEAKTKWCPFVRISVMDDDGENPALITFNRSAIRGTSKIVTPDACKCIASACMSWRVVTINELSEVVFAGTREGKRGTGYCGLAGRPE